MALIKWFASSYKYSYILYIFRYTFFSMYTSDSSIYSLFI